MKFRTILTGMAALAITSSSDPLFGEGTLTVKADVVVEDVEVSDGNQVMTNFSLLPLAGTISGNNLQ